MKPKSKKKISIRVKLFYTLLSILILLLLVIQLSMFISNSINELTKESRLSLYTLIAWKDFYQRTQDLFEIENPREFFNKEWSESRKQFTERLDAFHHSKKLNNIKPIAARIKQIDDIWKYIEINVKTLETTFASEETTALFEKMHQYRDIKILSDAKDNPDFAEYQETISLIEGRIDGIYLAIAGYNRQLTAVPDQVEAEVGKISRILKLIIYISLISTFILTFVISFVLSRRFNEYSKNMEKLVQERTADLQAANQVMREDLEMAQRVQLAMIPKDFSNFNRYNLDGYYLPMENLGGDFYDVIRISDEKLAFVIADVCGHGASAAMVTAMAKMTFINFSKQGQTTGEILKSVNDELFKIIGFNEYLTAFYCIIDLGKKTLEYTSASHPDILIMREKEEVIKLIPNSPIIGYTNDVVFNHNVIDIKPDDRLIFYTDGIIETRNKKDELFGMTKLEELVVHSLASNTKDAVDSIIREIDIFRNDMPLEDDITLLIVDIIGKKGELDISMETFIEKVQNEQIKNITNPANPTPTERKFLSLIEKMDEARQHIKDKKFRKAISLLEEIDGKFNRKSDNYLVKKLLGFAYYKTRDKEKTIEAWTKAYELNPEDTSLHSKISALKE